MSNPTPPVNYTFTTVFLQGIPGSRVTYPAVGSFNPVPPINPTTGKHTLNVGDTVTFQFQGAATNPNNTATVTSSAFIAICKSAIGSAGAAKGTTKTSCPVDGVTMTMTDDSIGFWGFTISFTADFTDSSGNVLSSEFFYLPDPEVDVETGGG